MKNIIAILSLAVVFISCEKTIDLDIDQTPSTIVIEGLVTNQAGKQSVKITKTADFYSSGSTPRVTTATVVVKDELGNEHIFVHNPGDDSDSAGIYIPQDGFVGEIGHRYTLTVDVDGKTYTAADDLVSVIGMDSLGYQLNPDEAEDPKFYKRAYEILMYTHEPQDETNFYLFKFYRNDSLKYYNDTDIYFSDDKYLAENINGIESPPFFTIGDKASIEAYSISRAGYVFYYDLSTLLNNDAGGMFGPIPASPRTNLSNGALGFFQVSAVTTSTIVLE